MRSLTHYLGHNVTNNTAQRREKFFGNNQEEAFHNLKEVVKAAYSQRIDSLFIAVGHQQQGTFNPQSNMVQF